MTPEQWTVVQRVLHEAILRDGAERDAYIESACASDAALRRRVDRLLEAHAHGGKLDALAARIATPLAALRHQASGDGPPAPVLSRYDVLEPLGSGGMGLVYRAYDRRLDRHVALKFLPPHLATADAAKRRFRAEAQATAALEHPNICTVYEIAETDDGQLYIAMPLYDGATLDKRIQAGRMPVGEAIRIALAIGDGLAKAHDRGIIHRDVKPPNVMITADGLVKILDFGIAKLVGLGADGATQPGTRVGTAHYMSPEQAAGEPVDHRTDIWSLGVVLYEMLGAQRPFAGAGERELLDAIAARDPVPLSARFENLPAAIDSILARALAKRPAARYESMRTFVRELAALHALLTPAIRSARPTAAPGDRARLGLALGSERRQVTILVATVAGYASVIERCPPDEAERLLGRVRNAAVDVARRHGASIEGLEGDQLRAVFGVPDIHEDDALRAVRAALELHARVREIAASVADGPGRSVRVQSGIHTAPAVIHRPPRDDGAYQVIGTALHSAVRLSALATPDEILASAECQRLISPFVAAESCAPVKLAAGAAPAVIYRVRGESGLETRLDAAERSGLTPYTGRSAELGTLRALLARACGGDGQLALVVGEAGAGKSRLLYELRRGLSDANVRVLKGRCQSYAGAAPYRPFVEALLAMIGLDERGDQRRSVEHIVSRIQAIDASLADFVPLYLHLLSIDSPEYRVPRHLQGERFKAAILDALVAIFAMYAGQHPTVVLFEDWHWVDEASRDVLRHLSEILAAQALLVVVSCRPEGNTDWLGIHNRTVISLGPLDRLASAAIMQSVLGAERVAAELSRQIHERTGGNPFFLEEVCQTLLEEGTVAVTAGEATAVDASGPVQLPDTVQAVIRTRLGRLDPEALEVLRVASVIGREFSRTILEDVRPSDIAPAQALGRLTAAGLLQQTSAAPVQAYRFKHVLTQEVTYDTLLEHQRKRLHAGVGRALERLASPQAEERLALLAHHFSHAEEWREAVHYGVQASERAAALSQFSDSLAALERAQSWLMHLPDDSSRRETLADILLRLERVCETLGLRGRQQRLVDELIALLAPLGASAKLGEAYLRRGDVSTLLKNFDAAGRALATALRIARELGDAAGERNALRSIGLLRWHEGNNAEALAIAEDALGIDRERQDEHAVAGDLANLGSILRGMGEYDRAQRCLEEALELGAVREDPIKQSFVLQHLANVHRSLGNAQRALEYLHRGAEQTRELRLPIQRSFHLTAIAHIYLQQGRVEESLRVYGEAVDLSRKSRHADGLAQGLRTLGEVLFGLGRDADALPLFTEGIALFAQLEDRRSESVMWLRIAAIRERAGSFAEASAAWRAARALTHETGSIRDELDAIEGMARCARREPPNGAAAIPLYEDAIALASARGEAEREISLRNQAGIVQWERGAYAAALHQYEAALRVVRTLDDPVHEGLVLNSLGLTLSRLRRYDEARTVLEQALALNRRTGEWLLEAHTLAVLGEVYAEVGRTDDAAAHYELAIAIRRRMQDRAGVGRLVERAASIRLSTTLPAE
ncbi:MAG: protein kinase domain-containing protein [Gemmatimonadaceae bacterium]